MTSPARIVSTTASAPLGHWALLAGLAGDSLGAVRVRIYRSLQTSADGDLPGVAVRSSWTAEPGGERVLHRELYQDDRRCVEEHWWQAGAVPADLIPARRRLAAEQRVVRTDRRDLMAGAKAAAVILPADQQAARSIGWLATAVSAALRGERRQVAAVAARFASAQTIGNAPPTTGAPHVAGSPPAVSSPPVGGPPPATGAPPVGGAPPGASPDWAGGKVRVAGGAEGRIWLEVETADRRPLLLAAAWFGCGPPVLSQRG